MGNKIAILLYVAVIMFSAVVLVWFSLVAYDMFVLSGDIADLDALSQELRFQLDEIEEQIENCTSPNFVQSG